MSKADRTDSTWCFIADALERLPEARGRQVMRWVAFWNDESDPPGASFEDVLLSDGLYLDADGPIELTQEQSDLINADVQRLDAEGLELVWSRRRPERGKAFGSFVSPPGTN